MNALDQPCLLPSISARIRHEEPAGQRDEPERVEAAVAPGRSTRAAGASRRRTATTPIGMLTKKIQRHESHEVSMPPASGPIATAAPIVAPQSPNAVPRSLPVELLREQRQRRREHHRAADPLDAAGEDQEERVVRGAAGRRGEREEHDAEQEQPLAAEEVGERARGQDARRERRARRRRPPTGDRRTRRPAPARSPAARRSRS